MNASPILVHRALRIGISLALAQLGVSASPATAPERASRPVAAPKTHVLFMGANIALEKDKSFHSIEDVTATALIIKPAGKTVAVPLEAATNLQINEALKIADRSVIIADLKSDRVYTPGADPYRTFGNSVALAAGESATSDLARGELMGADQAVMGASSQFEQARAAGAPNAAEFQANLNNAQGVQASAAAAVTQSYNGAGSNFSDVAGQSVAAGNEASQERYDAIRLSFEVTPEKDLAQPYYAVIAQIREPGSKTGQARKWAYVKSLGPIHAGTPKRVSFFRGGFPPGYILESCEVHLYDRGEELATNFSRKRVPLTDDEALDFRIIEYVGANKGRTLPALPASTTLTGETRASLTPEQLNETCYVRVTKDGRVAATFSDAAGKEPLQDPALEAALKSYRFKPALNSGKPVEAIVPVKLARLL